MALKAFLETLEGVDDAVKSYYAEADGKFVLQIEGVDNHPEVANLKSAYERVKIERETAKKDMPGLRAKIAELEKGAPDTAATQARLTALQEKLDAAEAKAVDLTGKLTGVTRDRALADALQSSGVTDPTFLKASQAMLSGMVKMGDDGTAYVDTGMGPKVLGDYVKGWTATEGKAFVAPAKGTGSQGSDKGTSGRSMSRADFEAMAPQDQRKAVVADKIQII